MKHFSLCHFISNYHFSLPKSLLAYSFIFNIVFSWFHNKVLALVCFFFFSSKIFLLKNLFFMQFLLLNFPQPTLSFPITAVILFALICMTYSMAEDKIHFEDFKKITHRKMSFSTPVVSIVVSDILFACFHTVEYVPTL